MSIALIVSMIICVPALLLIVACVSIQDIRIGRISKLQRQHPHARKWRARPLVSIVTSGEPAPASIASISSNTYRNKQIIRDTSAASEIAIILPAGAVLARSAIKNAVFYFAANPQAVILPVAPLLPPPHSLQTFFRHYMIVLGLPLASTLATFGWNSPSVLLPFATRFAHAQQSFRPFMTFATWILHAGGVALVAYACFLAAIAMQPLLLLFSLALFGLWALWAIAQYPQLAFQSKLRMLLLLPAVIPYLLYRLIASLFHLPAIALQKSKSAIIDT